MPSPRSATAWRGSTRHLARSPSTSPSRRAPRALACRPSRSGCRASAQSRGTSLVFVSGEPTPLSSSSSAPRRASTRSWPGLAQRPAVSRRSGAHPDPPSG
ncbi:hypothetical protein N865_19535 [Intrasporangium oryzae NRRL B-24470]|uniref:Uncharacterized protein n=1 Tax=Intrasporangium oryzae NRRL B-24470 TaxID=1386089 RepID=W9G206_9MICO|nr:hypothetical protein N865_19535 [Intrasporangium oryzae NRRL B-24470]